MTFKFFIGGYFSGHFEVILKRNELHFSVSEYPIMLEIQKPTHVISIKEDMDWRDLITFLDNVKWDPNYHSDRTDGIQWTMTFKSASKKLKCYGSNAFPMDFDNFIMLLKKITAKHNIPDEIVQKNV